MDVSIFLAKALGLYLFIFSIPLLFYTENFISIVSGMLHNASMQFVLGMNILTMGILMVISHNRWEASWIVVITILAWMTLVKGILYIVFPKMVNHLSQAAMHSRYMLRINSVICLLIGAYLSYMGFFAS